MVMELTLSRSTSGTWRMASTSVTATPSSVQVDAVPLADLVGQLVEQLNELPMLVNRRVSVLGVQLVEVEPGLGKHIGEFNGGDLSVRPAQFLGSCIAVRARQQVLAVPDDQRGTNPTVGLQALHQPPHVLQIPNLVVRPHRHPLLATLLYRMRHSRVTGSDASSQEN